MLDDNVRRLATGANFASLATVMPSGDLQVQVMWVDCDEDHILVNTEVHRRKFLNLTADPRATVLIVNRDDPWDYVEVRGRVAETVTGPAARAHIDKLAHKYFGKETYPNPIVSERVIVKVAPTRVFKFPPG